MPTIDELLSNGSLKDDMELSVGDNKFTLGDLRKEQSKRQQDIAAKEASLNAERQRVNKLAEDALTLWESMKNEPVKPPAKVNADGGDDDYAFEDPRLVKAFKKVMVQLEDAQKKQAEEMSKYQKALTEGFQYVVTDKYERQWDSLPDKPADKTWKDYLKVAQDNKIVDQWGLPDPIKAYQESTKAEREAKMKEAEYKRGLEEGRKASPQMPRPGNSGPTKPQAKPDKTYDSIESLLDDAFNDPDIIKASQVQ